ncbi:threonine ammonia-lyase, biosynthetic [Pseudobacteriovorax antillogorgiicola]|uniref:L-threonine dehydratase n=1 Tax=Pseudobacteriovorax antillogorgiicola TaxID=1513793 RepID=A0A1Y6BJ46_9BACT|nr:threonine ammonia-lyase, biosynthetic [Pseudobacteriovorax antillogorgiicola]TCS55340.1 L-threonine ammonia-lyase [Pseudobacteriovorax antillogorgiicola]SMF13968.1 L-threonine ammonia-lyase [Pseudobacteriovorax antillogorgiicola]
MPKPSPLYDELFKEVLKAPIYDLVKHTPLEYARLSSQDVGHELYFKREDLQDIFSFKIRGAYNKIKQLNPEEKAAGVICVSAGNHGQGVALAGRSLGVPVTVVMPVTTPEIKIQGVRSFGASIALHGDSYSDAESHCWQLQKQLGATFIHPFDDPLVIAGQGTTAKEIYSDLPDLDDVFVPVGGGGLLAGMALYLKALRPDIRIIGVEPQESDAMHQSLRHGSVISLGETGTFADGVAVKRVGQLTFDIIRHLVDDWVLVSTDEICSAIEYVYLDTRTILEPAGALSLAGARRYLRQISNSDSKRKVVCINSGANMNFQRMQYVAERILTGDGRESLYGIQLKEKAGSLRKFCHQVLGQQSITEFNYRFSGGQKAYIFVGIANQSTVERRKLARSLDEEGYSWTDLTDNDLAKDHIRHMVGGVQSLPSEQLVSFQFPERPGALMEFLDQMGREWNISLFHYRSQGSDYGRVLMGLQVPPAEEGNFRSFLESIQYPYQLESENAVIGMFLNSGAAV